MTMPLTFLYEDKESKSQLLLMQVENWRSPQEVMILSFGQKKEQLLVNSLTSYPPHAEDSYSLCCLFRLSAAILLLCTHLCEMTK